MRTQKQKIIYTIGHSTRTLEHFVSMLQSFSIEVVVDVRSFPGHAAIRILIKKILKFHCPQKI